MKIGIDASRANRDYKSGTEWYAYHIIRWLAEIDKENQYILYSDKPLKSDLLNLNKENKEDTEELEPKIERNGFQKIISPHNNFTGKILKWPFEYFWTQGRLSIEMMMAKPDVLFVPAHALPIIHPKKSIVTIHDIGYEKNGLLYQKEKLGAEGAQKRKIINFFVKIFTLGKYEANSVDYLKWSTGYALKKASKIITISEFAKSEIEKVYNKKFKNIEIVYHGYDEKLYKKINDEDKILEVLEKYEIKKPYFFYIGRIEKKKNIPALVEAFAIFKEKNKDSNFRLLLAGSTGYGYDEVKYMISEFGIEQDVVMPGWAKEKDIPFLYNGASFFIFPSKYEGFGIPLLEAMACETPILASDRSSIPEITQGAAILFDPDNVRTIAQAMEKISIDKDLKNKLVSLGRDRVKNFSWEKTAKKTLDILTD